MDKPKPNNAPIYVAALYPKLAEIARKHGYALAAHGSAARDLDLVAIPWTEDAADPLKMIREFESTFAMKRAHPRATRKPHGRRAWAIYFSFASCYLDLSVMPLAKKQD